MIRYDKIWQGLFGRSIFHKKRMLMGPQVSTPPRWHFDGGTSPGGFSSQVPGADQSLRVKCQRPLLDGKVLGWRRGSKIYVEPIRWTNKQQATICPAMQPGAFFAGVDNQLVGVCLFLICHIFFGIFCISIVLEAKIMFISIFSGLCVKCQQLTTDQPNLEEKKQANLMGTMIFWWHLLSSFSGPCDVGNIFPFL